MFWDCLMLQPPGRWIHNTRCEETQSLRASHRKETRRAIRDERIYERVCDRSCCKWELVFTLKQHDSEVTSQAPASRRFLFESTKKLGRVDWLVICLIAKTRTKTTDRHRPATVFCHVSPRGSLSRLICDR